MTDTKREAPPDLEFRAPDCPMCGKETACDSDSFWCENGCGAEWGRDGTKGEWHEPDAPQCDSRIQPFRDSGYPNIADTVFRCILAEGHKAEKHCHPDYFDWSDTDAVRKAPNAA